MEYGAELTNVAVDKLPVNITKQPETKVSDVKHPADWQWDAEDAEKELEETVPVAVKANYTGKDKENYEIQQITITVTRSACEHPATKTEGKIASTCTQNGYTGDIYCEQCGRKLKDGIETAKQPHELKKTEKKDATAVAAGNIEYYHCEVCGRYFSDSEGRNEITKDSTVIPATGEKPTEPTTEPSTKPAVKPAKKGTKLVDSKGTTYSVTVKTTKLTGNSVGTNAFKEIYYKAVIKVPKSKLKYYTKLLKKRGVSSKAKIKK